MPDPKPDAPPIAPRIDDHGVGWCDNGCRYYRWYNWGRSACLHELGDRSVADVQGHTCYPRAIEAAEDHTTMELVRQSKLGVNITREKDRWTCWLDGRFGSSPIDLADAIRDAAAKAEKEGGR